MGQPVQVMAAQGGDLAALAGRSLGARSGDGPAETAANEEAGH